MPILGIMASQITGHLSTNSFESIATVNLSSAAQNTITFSSIPSTYKHLQLRIMTKSTSTGTGVGWGGFTFNNDTGNNYTLHVLYGSGSITGAYGAANYSAVCYSLPGGNVGTNMFGISVVDIFDYTNTNKYKTTRSLGGGEFNGTGGEELDLISGVWMNTSAITSITFSGGANNFARYSSFALYGIK